MKLVSHKYKFQFDDGGMLVVYHDCMVETGAWHSFMNGMPIEAKIIEACVAEGKLMQWSEVAIAQLLARQLQDMVTEGREIQISDIDD